MNDTPLGRSDDEIAGWLRSAAGQLEVRLPDELLPGARASVSEARRRRRRRLAVAVPAGAALAAVAIGAGVLAGGGPDSRATIMPVAGLPTVLRGPAPAPPTEAPAAADGAPLQLRYVDTPRLVPLTAAQREEIDSHCAPETTRLFVAVADRWGLQVLLVGADGGGMCRTFHEPATVPDLTGINGPILWPGGRHDLTTPPTAPVEVFSSGDDGSGMLGAWNARRWAVGQVSPQVALLVAALPTGDAVVVPFEPSSGAFITRIQVTTPDLAQYQTIGQMPLTLYAYNSAGTLVAQFTATACGQMMMVCNSGPGTSETHLPSPLSPSQSPTSGMGRPIAPRTPSAG
ncbi:hypothetical protein [Parafrankia elaeagni]|uniref:hypothetical protein n=1 Tax=Parafrankia elaeagni TaxID=222534 RepID=UPI00036ABE8E|nr:hypothetical protein [Parafrankia elaeagni]